VTAQQFHEIYTQAYSLRSEQLTGQVTAQQLLTFPTFEEDLSEESMVEPDETLMPLHVAR
jgi:hypothetical protein